MGDEDDTDCDDATLEYKWYKDGGVEPVGSGRTYTIDSAKKSDSGSYSVTACESGYPDNCVGSILPAVIKIVEIEKVVHESDENEYDSPMYINESDTDGKTLRAKTVPSGKDYPSGKPEWTVTPSGKGTVSPTTGKDVIFTLSSSANAGDIITVTASNCGAPKSMIIKVIEVNLNVFKK